MKITDLLLAEAVRLKSSDVFVEPMEHDLSIRYRVDGVLQKAKKSPPKSMHRGIVSRIKVMSKLDIAEKRLPQDGRISLKIAGRAVDVIPRPGGAVIQEVVVEVSPILGKGVRRKRSLQLRGLVTV